MDTRRERTLGSGRPQLENVAEWTNLMAVRAQLAIIRFPLLVKFQLIRTLLGVLVLLRLRLLVLLVLHKLFLEGC